MSAAFATVTEEDGVVATSARVNGFALAELRFPPGYVQPTFEPELPYLAVVLDGALVKRFRRRSLSLGRTDALTMASGAAHDARFGPEGARIVVVKPVDGSSPLAASLDRLAELRGAELGWLARRLARELGASDAAAPLAAEGLALELLAATSREGAGTRRGGRPPAWLGSVEELVRARSGECVRLGELARAVGVHPTHLARVFREHHGVSVGEYGRRVRLARAAVEVERGDTSLALIATRAGFADQSHFTRVFRQHVGTTPARYREQTRDARDVPGRVARVQDMGPNGANPVVGE